MLDIAPDISLPGDRFAAVEVFLSSCWRKWRRVSAPLFDAPVPAGAADDRDWDWNEVGREEPTLDTHSATLPGRHPRRISSASVLRDAPPFKSGAGSAGAPQHEVIPLWPWEKPSFWRGRPRVRAPRGPRTGSAAVSKDAQAVPAAAFVGVTPSDRFSLLMKSLRPGVAMAAEVQ